MANDRLTRMRGLAPLVLAAALCMALTACDPAADPGEPSSTPTPSVTDTPEPSETPISLAIPATCEQLVATDIITDMFGDDYEVLPDALLDSNPEAQDFEARGGLSCAWGLPASEAMVLVFVAERASSSDAEWVEEMQTLGFSEGPDFLDECMVKIEDTEVGSYVTTRTTVEGYEIYVFGNGTDYNPYLTISRAASDSMGYL